MAFFELIKPNTNINFVGGGPNNTGGALPVNKERPFGAADLVRFWLCRIVGNVVDLIESQRALGRLENFTEDFADPVKDHLAVRKGHVERASHRGEIALPFG